MTRSATSKEILDVEWDYPVPDTFAEARSRGRTYAKTARTALSREAAFAKIAGEDRRPLLVMRECVRCKGTEHAVFGRRLNNEKTKLLLHWFHCVKLPPDVLKKDHPFHALFATKSAHVPHLFIAMANGKSQLNFSGAQPETMLQKELTKLIHLSYDKKPKPAIKMMMKFLSQFDMLDSNEGGLLQRLDRVREERGPNSSGTRSIRKQLAKVRAAKKKAMQQAKAVCDLKLRVVKEKKKAD